MAAQSRLLSCVALMLCPIALSGCGGLTNRLNPAAVSARGLDPSIEALNYQKVASDQSALITELGNMAQITTLDLAAQDPRWELVMKSGVALVGSQCNEYLTALYHFDRDNKAIRSGLTATGTAATTIMGLAGTAANPIAATAAVFGLSEAYFDANVNAVVFQIGPAAVRNIVVKSQDAYRDSVMANIKIYHSRPDVIIGLQGYLQLCTPVAIESAVEAGASSISFDLKQGSTTTDPQPPIQQESGQNTVPQSNVVLQTIVVSAPNVHLASTQKLMNWLYPKGIPNAVNEASLGAWMNSKLTDKNLAGKPWPLLLSPDGKNLGSSAQQLEIDRLQAIADLDIK